MLHMHSMHRLSHGKKSLCFVASRFFVMPLCIDTPTATISILGTAGCQGPHSKLISNPSQFHQRQSNLLGNQMFDCCNKANSCLCTKIICRSQPNSPRHPPHKVHKSFARIHPKHPGGMEAQEMPLLTPCAIRNLMHAL